MRTDDDQPTNQSNKFSSKQPLKVSVGLCTYKRPQVVQTLESLFNQKVTPAFSFTEIIVVDNDVEQSAQTLIQTLQVPAHINLIYVSEPEKNIAGARNQILKHASGDWLALIDDDEVASPVWLSEYVKAVSNHQAVAFFGPVISIYPQGCPDWIRLGQFFDRPQHKDASRMQAGATCNAFVDMSVVRREQLEFSRAYGLTGGEDSHFFYRLHQAGQSLLWVSGAVVEEEVESRRLTAEFLRKKHFRIGQTFSRYRGVQPGKAAQFQYYIKLLAKRWGAACVALVLQLPALFSVQAKIAHMKWQLKSVDAKGKLSGLGKASDFLEIY